MKQSISTSILIKASPAKVWNVLTNFKNYPNWNPFIKQIEGDIKVGKKFSAIIQAPNNKPMKFKPEVLIFDANKEFKWIGYLLIPGLFDGEHRFQLIDNHDGSTTLMQSENFKGLLVPLFKNMLQKDTYAGFEMMNEKLKSLCEL